MLGLFYFYISGIISRGSVPEFVWGRVSMIITVPWWATVIALMLGGFLEIVERSNRWNDKHLAKEDDFGLLDDNLRRREGR
jgi:hypothetical protein